ncbi:MAG: DUF4286 family protein [Bacteroidota bacterium]
MILYNVTIKVDFDIHDEWIQWMKEVHIPEVLATGYFVENKVYRLMEEISNDGITYAVQYTCNSISDYMTYQEKHAAELQKSHGDRYKDKFVAFRTLLKEV